MRREAHPWRVIVVGGHTRNIGKTQLVCDIIRAFPRATWIAGKITQHGHGICAQNGTTCGCAPDEHVSAFDWETNANSGTDSSRFLAAGARQSFWLRTKQGFLAEAMPLLRSECAAIADTTEPDHRNLIVESNSLMKLLKPSLYFAVIDPAKEDFKETALEALDRAHALVLRGSLQGLPGAAPDPFWLKVPPRLLKEKPSVVQAEGEDLPNPLRALIDRLLQSPCDAAI